jgi:Fe-S cluster biogenesis protein NfuA
MFIQIQETPNPNTLKFLPGFIIMPEGQTASFKTLDDCGISKLAKELLEVDGVESIFYGHDFISVTKNEKTSWHSLKSIIVATIVDYNTSGMPILEGNLQKVQRNSEDLSLDEQEIVRQIVEVIDEKVKPAVAQDGGDIEFHSYKDGVVYVTMHGACAGCPSSTLTLKDGIENMLQYYIPEVIRVEQI